MTDSQLVRQQQQELSKAAADIKNIVASMSGLPRHLTTQLDHAIKAVSKDATSQYEKELRKLIKGESKSAEERRRILMEIHKIERDLLLSKESLEKQRQKAEQNHADSVDRASKATQELQQATANLTAAQNQHSLLMSQSSQVTLNNAIKEVQTKQSAAQAAIEAEKKAEQAAKELEKQFQDLDAQIAKSSVEFEKIRTASTDFRTVFRENITQSGKHFGKQMVDMIAGMVSFTSGVKLLYDGTKKLIATGININALEEARLNYIGMSTAEYAEISKKNRAIILAQGGTAQSISNLEQASAMFASTLPDLAERNKAVVAGMNNLMKAGLTPTAQNMSAFADGWNKVRKTTNMSAEEYAAFLDEQMDNDAVRVQLKTATSDKERDAIIRGIANRASENALMGVSIELQKKRNAAAAAELKKPVKERVRESFMLQQAAIAVGMSPEQAQLMGAIKRKGVGASASEKETLTKLLDEMNKRGTAKYTEAAAAGNVGYQLFHDYMTEKTGSEAMNIYSDTFGQKLVPAADNAASGLGEVSESTKKVVNAFEHISNTIMKSPWIQMIGGGAANVGKSMGYSATDFFTTAAGTGAGILGAKAVLGTGAAAAGSGAAAAGTGAATAAATALPLLAAVATGGALGYGIHKSGIGQYIGTDWLGGKIAEMLPDPEPSPEAKAAVQQQIEESRAKRKQLAEQEKNTAKIKETEQTDPTARLEKDNASRLQKIADNSDFLPKILDVAEKSLAVAVASSGSDKRGGMKKLLKTGASAQSWSNLVTQD